jgi:hypothetical protein
LKPPAPDVCEGFALRFTKLFALVEPKGFLRPIETGVPMSESVSITLEVFGLELLYPELTIPNFYEGSNSLEARMSLLVLKPLLEVLLMKVDLGIGGFKISASPGSIVEAPRPSMRLMFSF